MNDRERSIAIRTRSCHFDPPGTFPQDVLDYHFAEPGEERHRTPGTGPVFHATMDRETLDAYLTWRRDLWEGRPVSRD